MTANLRRLRCEGAYRPTFTECQTLCFQAQTVGCCATPWASDSSSVGSKHTKIIVHVFEGDVSAQLNVYPKI